jgi:signal transduction histidine kinase
MERLLSLSELDVDYCDQQDSFKDLAKLAAKVTGTKISLVNLVDSLTQWTIASYGFDIGQMLREDSVCQYTIMGSDAFEVTDLSADDRFKDKRYVVDDPNVRYYYGVPLRTHSGQNIGALCVMDEKQLVLDPEKIELVKIIADEIVNRLRSYKMMENLKVRLLEAKQIQKKVAHDIRGPLGGIVGLAQIIRDQGEHNQMDEVLEFINLIHKSGNSILDLAEEILDSQKDKVVSTQSASSLQVGGFNLAVFKDKLEKLYWPQALQKQINFEIKISEQTEKFSFSRDKLLQITGNIISNAIKFTPQTGTVAVNLDLDLSGNPNLRIVVADNGVGMAKETIQAILDGNASTTDGTDGEQGYGFGLSLVKHLVINLNGQVSIDSEIGKGTTVTIDLPQKIQ